MHPYRTIMMAWSFFLFCTYALAQPTKSESLYIDTTSHIETGGKLLYINYPKEYNTYATANADTLLKIEKIAKFNFRKLSTGKASSSVTNDSTDVAFTKSSFTIRNRYFERTFNRNVLCDCFIYDYYGVIPALHLYALVAMNMQEQTAFTGLVDYKTGLFSRLPSCFNKQPQAIVLSPLNNYLLSFTNSTFEQGSCGINLLHIDKNENTTNFSLQPSMTIYFDRINIQKLVWLNDSSFIMEVTENEKEVADDNNSFGKKIKRFLKITVIK